MAHHAIFWVNNSTQLGVAIKPFTYRVSQAPSFFPRFSIGAAEGIDLYRWRSWIQSRFDGGAGQYIWSSSTPTNRFAESHLVDIGYVGYRKAEVVGLVGDTPVNVNVWEDLSDTVVADVAGALMPTQTTSSVIVRDLFTQRYPLSIVMMSHRPHLWQYRVAMVYTNIQDTQAWESPALDAGVNKLTGTWEVIATSSTSYVVTDAVVFSGHIFLAYWLGSEDVSSLMAYGSQHTAGQTPATFYFPAYTTRSYQLAVYDNKLWRSWKGEAYYLVPTSTTVNAHWETLGTAGDPTVKITNMIEFNGKLYLGKEDSLWVIDSGVVYRIEDFSDYRDPFNFRVFNVHRGHLYFNIRHMLYRLSTEGLMELMQTPITEGALMGAASSGQELYYISKKVGEYADSEVWVFNDETGGSRRYFSARRMSREALWSHPEGLTSQAGVLWIAPMMMTHAVETSSEPQPYVPVVAVDRVSPVSRRVRPNYAKTDSYLITSMLDFGLPNLSKEYNRVIVDYELYDASDRIDVFWLNRLESRKQVDTIYGQWLDGTVQETDELIDFHDTRFNDETTYRWGEPYAAPGDIECFLFGFPAIPTLWGDQTTHPSTAGLPDSITFWMDNTSDAQMVYRLAERLSLRVYCGGSEFARYWQWVDFTLDVSIERVEGIPLLGLRFMFDPSSFSSMMLAKSALDLGVGTDTTLSYWIAIRRRSTKRTVVIHEVTFTGTSSRKNLLGQPWRVLGNITGSNDFVSTKKSFSFPKLTKGEDIMLMFKFWGSELTRPGIRRYEIEYMPSPSPLGMIDFVAVAMDAIEAPDLAAQYNSGYFIAKSLFSMAFSGASYVVGLPWPESHTISAKVSIANPGALVPYLAPYDPVTGHGITLPDPHPDPLEGGGSVTYEAGAYSPSEIPVHLDEL